MLRRKLNSLGLRIAYPGILGIPQPEFVTYQSVTVTYDGEPVTYKDPGEVVRP